MGREEKFLRFHTEAGKPEGKFFIREKEVTGIINDPKKLRQFLGLKNEPVYMTEVYIPEGSRMYVGRIGAQPKFGLNNKSGFQYQLIDRISDSEFYRYNRTVPIDRFADVEYNAILRGYRR